MRYMDKHKAIMCLLHNKGVVQLRGGYFLHVEELRLSEIVQWVGRLKGTELYQESDLYIGHEVKDHGKLNRPQEVILSSEMILKQPTVEVEFWFDEGGGVSGDLIQGDDCTLEDGFFKKKIDKLLRVSNLISCDGKLSISKLTKFVSMVQAESFRTADLEGEAVKIEAPYVKDVVIKVVEGGFDLKIEYVNKKKA